MNGLEVNGVTLYLTRIPGRKGLAFCFLDGSVISPVAYVSEKLEDMAIVKWKKMLGEER